MTNTPAEQQEDLEWAMAALVAFRSGGPVETLHSVVDGAQSWWRAVLGLLTLSEGLAQRCAEAEESTAEAVVRDVALRIAQTAPPLDD